MGALVGQVLIGGLWNWPFMIRGLSTESGQQTFHFQKNCSVQVLVMSRSLGSECMCVRDETLVPGVAVGQSSLLWQTLTE